MVDFLLLFAGGVAFGIGLMGLIQMLRRGGPDRVVTGASASPHGARRELTGERPLGLAALSAFFTFGR
jgi:hypothetical protein